MLLIGLFLTFYPFMFMIFSSLKDYAQFFHSFWWPAFPLHLENYKDAFKIVYKYIVNSVMVSATSALGVVVLASISAYVFARFNFPGREPLFYAVISLLMIPGLLTLIPRFLLARFLGLVDSLAGLILFYIAGGQVFGIFILRSFFSSLPEELFEAARLDGAGELHSYALIAVPLSKSILGTVAIMNVLSTWNEYIWPLVIISSDRLKTIPLGLIAFQTMYRTEYGPLFAGYVIASLPLLVLFFFTMRTFVAGLTSGALKA